METFTVAQIQRLKELNCNEGIFKKSFSDKEECNLFYRNLELQLSRENKEKIVEFLEEKRRPILSVLEDNLINWLTKEQEFTQVITPIILPKKMLEKMTITSDHPLYQQVFWLDSKKCLRPMLAPNLYIMMKDIRRAVNGPVKIFESGPCFRKESQGAKHLNEFTMLNLVEFASIEDGKQMNRLKELANSAMNALGIDDYILEVSESEVYGETLDIVYKGVEVASGSYGPHSLDCNWGVFETWVGIGFGLERIAMLMGNYSNIKRVGRSLAYVNGARLTV